MQDLPIEEVEKQLYMIDYPFLFEEVVPLILNSGFNLVGIAFIFSLLVLIFSFSSFKKYLLEIALFNVSSLLLMFSIALFVPLSDEDNGMIRIAEIKKELDAVSPDKFTVRAYKPYKLIHTAINSNYVSYYESYKIQFLYQIYLDEVKKGLITPLSIKEGNDLLYLLKSSSK